MGAHTLVREEVPDGHFLLLSFLWSCIDCTQVSHLNSRFARTAFPIVSCCLATLRAHVAAAEQLFRCSTARRLMTMVATTGSGGGGGDGGGGSGGKTDP